MGLLDKALTDILSFAEGGAVTKGGVETKGKKRNFIETIEMQVTLKNYDPQREKRFSGTFKLPSLPRPNLKCCVLGNAAHCEQADRISVDLLTMGSVSEHATLEVGAGKR